MKVYSIGRDVACNIVINDNSDVISRRHAILNVSPSGKMTIVDQSHNGTYVNGIRISSNVPVPVTRKDNISFAHVARLDWNQIPNTRAKIIRIVLIAIVAFVFVVCGLLGLIFWGTCSTLNGIFGGGEEPAPTTTVVTDTASQKKDTVPTIVAPVDTPKTEAPKTKTAPAPVKKTKGKQATTPTKPTKPETPAQEEVKRPY